MFSLDKQTIERKILVLPKYKEMLKSQEVFGYWSGGAP
jgi:hypothetical protein